MALHSLSSRRDLNPRHSHGLLKPRLKRCRHRHFGQCQTAHRTELTQTLSWRRLAASAKRFASPHSQTSSHRAPGAHLGDGISLSLRSRSRVGLSLGDGISLGHRSRLGLRSRFGLCLGGSNRRCLRSRSRVGLCQGGGISLCPRSRSRADLCLGGGGSLGLRSRSRAGPCSTNLGLRSSSRVGLCLGAHRFVNNKELSGPDTRVCEVRGLQKAPDQAAA